MGPATCGDRKATKGLHLRLVPARPHVKNKRAITASPCAAARGRGLGCEGRGSGLGGRQHAWVDARPARGPRRGVGTGSARLGTRGPDKVDAPRRGALRRSSRLLRGRGRPQAVDVVLWVQRRRAEDLPRVGKGSWVSHGSAGGVRAVNARSAFTSSTRPEPSQRSTSAGRQDPYCLMS